MKKIAFAFILSVTLLSACGNNSNSGGMNMDHTAHTGTTMPEQGHGSRQSTAPTANPADVQSVWKLSSDKPQPKQDTTLTLQIKDKQGKAIDKYDINHEKQLHLIVVSKDLSFFNHIHPEYKGNGEFTITTQFPAGGQYKLIADFIPTGMGTMTKTDWVTVQGEAPKQAAIEPDTNMTKVVDGKEVTLSFDHIMAGMDLTMTFNIKDAVTKAPITNLQPYLGAVGHVVALSADTEQYLHVHPMEEKATGPDAKFMTSFPKSGVYKIWGQFQHNGKVFVVPFVVKVP